MAPENSPPTPAAGSVAQASPGGTSVPAQPAPSSVAPKAVGKKKGLLVIVVIAVLLLGGVTVGGYFAYKALSGGTSLGNLFKSEEEVAKSAVDAATDNMAKVFQSRTEVENNLPGAFAEQFAAPYGVGQTSGLPNMMALVSADEEEFDSFAIDYGLAIATSSSSVDATLSGKMSISDDTAQVTMNLSGMLDYEGSEIPMQASLTALMVDNDSYLKLEDVPRETIDAVIDVVFMSELGSMSGQMSSAELAQLNMMVSMFGDQFEDSLMNKWLYIEGEEQVQTEPEEGDVLTDDQVESLSALYAETFSVDNAEYKGKEKIGGVTTYRWDYNLTEEDIDRLIEEQCKIIDGDDAYCPDNSFSESAKLNGFNVWLTEKGELRKIELSLEADMQDAPSDVPVIGGEEALYIDISFSLVDINNVDKFTAPSDYVDFEDAVEELTSVFMGM